MVKLYRVFLERTLVEEKMAKRTKNMGLLGREGKIAYVPLGMFKQAEAVSKAVRIPKFESMDLFGKDFPEIINIRKTRMPRTKMDEIEVTYKKKYYRRR
jgi:hypothetical protein